MKFKKESIYIAFFLLLFQVFYFVLFAIGYENQIFLPSIIIEIIIVLGISIYFGIQIRDSYYVVLSNFFSISGLALGGILGNLLFIYLERLNFESLIFELVLVRAYSIVLSYTVQVILAS